jgi:hypothetical protein
VQLSVRRHVRLNEQHGFFRIKPRRQPVQRDFQRIFFHAGSVSVVGGERVPVDYAEEALILILHAYPILKRAHIVSQVKLAGRTHAAEHALPQVGRRCHQFFNESQK